jgi:radical SAM superfamily enzyme YgiQ (UPF0313 family)
MNIGFRKLAGYVNKELDYETGIYYYTLGQTFKSYYKQVLGKFGEDIKDNQNQLRAVAEAVADSDIVAFSSMSPYASSTRKLIDHVKSINPNAYTVWGGIHPIVQPEDAIQYADAICTGEGEFAFEEFLSRYAEGKDFTGTKNFWFNHNGEVIRNQHRPLMSEDEMTDLPLMQYGEDEKIYRSGEGFVELTPKIYRQYTGLTYNTIWTIGCPLHCTFCANTKFIENHSDYTQVRHTPPSRIVSEVEQALEVHPWLSSVTLHDDSMMALHPDTLREFGEKWKKRLDIPFMCMGVIPNYVTEERVKILLDAGMHRIRMGIQSGSEEILEFYKRPAPPDKVREATSIISRYEDYMIPPLYEIIVDNPVETKDDIQDTIELMDGISGGYHLEMYSLRTIPNTELEQQLEERDLTTCKIGESTFADVSPTLAHALLYLNATVNLPDWLYDRLYNKAKPARETESFHPILLIVTRFFHYLKVGIQHVRYLEFGAVAVPFGYLLWKLGLMEYWRNWFVPEFNLDEPGPEPQSPETPLGEVASDRTW